MLLIPSLLPCSFVIIFCKVERLQVVGIYFIGYSEEAVDLDLAKQYNKANEKIIVESVKDVYKRQNCNLSMQL